MALLFIGAISGTGEVQLPPGVERLAFPGFSALGLHVDPEAAEQEDGIVDWARRQNEVLCQLIPKFSVLPVPLGSLFSGCSAMEDAMVQQGDVIRANLELLSDCVEYGLHVAGTEKEQPDARVQGSDGRDFLLKKRSQVMTRRSVGRRKTAFVQDVHTALMDHCSDVIERPTKGHKIMDKALLVRRAQEAPMIGTLRNLSAGSSALGLRVSLVGPTPAYSFSPGFMPMEEKQRA